MSRERTVSADYLQQLNDAVAELVMLPEFRSTIQTLKAHLQDAAEPFVWSTVDLKFVTTRLPDNIRSGWIFVLKKDVPSGCHFHPNSIQHMVVIEGDGTSRVGSVSSEMKRFGTQALEETWYVIPAGVPHEFFPGGTDVVVVSFHTCDSDELEEISCDTGAARNYETRA